MSILSKGITFLAAAALLTCLPGGPAAQVRDAGGEELDAEGAAMHKEAAEAVSQGRFADAILSLRAFLARYPDRLVETQWLAMSYNAEGLYTETIELLDAARAKWPRDYILAEDHGTALLETGRADEAVRAWHSVLGPSADIGYYYQVSRLEWSAGMYDRAVATLKEAQKDGKHGAQLAMEIVRMERMRGNYREAFMQILPWLESSTSPEVNAGLVTEIFVEAGRPAELAAAIDSMAALGGEKESFYRALYAALLVQAGEYGSAEPWLRTASSGRVPEKDLYFFVMHLVSMKDRAGDEGFERCLESAVSSMANRFSRSQRAAAVLLEAARHAERLAGRGGPGAREAALRAVALADSVVSHERGRPYAEWALITKARVQLESLRDPAAALRTVDSIRWRQADTSRRMMDIRLSALMLSGDWEGAGERFEKLASSPDSVTAAAGRYGRGMVLFYRGDFEKAAAELSAMAKEAPWSRWANDALDTAVLIRRAERDVPSVLPAFASAIRSGQRGMFLEAADSLYSAAERFPDSPLAPEALYESALLLGRAGRREEAAARLGAVAERYPLSRIAPRAVETLASLLEEASPQEAAKWYTVFLDRYGDDPWTTRVRAGYMRLRARMGEDSGEGGGGA